MLIQQALTLFTDTLLAEDSSPKTASYYRYHVENFIRFLPAGQQTIGNYGTSDVIAFIADERARGKSKVTVYGCYRALDGFFNWCADSEEVGRPWSPMKNRDGKRVVKVKKPPFKKARRADIKVVDALIDFLPPDNWIHLRNRVALRLLRDTGVRISEAINVKLADLDLVQRLLTIPESKSRKDRQVRFTTTLAEEIR